MQTRCGALYPGLYNMHSPADVIERFYGVAVDTSRLRLRQWREGDYPEFAAMNADPAVMVFYPAVLSRAESDAMADKLCNLIATRGWGFWAVDTNNPAKVAGPT